MSEVASTLHMVQISFDAGRLAELGRRLGLSLRHTDPSYLVHCALGTLFQEQAPKPFWIDGGQRLEQGRLLRVLSYAAVDGETLRELARGFCPPDAFETVRWDYVASKPMPDVFPRGMQLGFEARVCPVVRKHAAGARWHAGQEIDVFLDKAWSGAEEPVDREGVYRAWLSAAVERQGGAQLVNVGLGSFTLERMLRRTQGAPRRQTAVMRPDATLRGVLRVEDEGLFRELLRRGIGRHRSFGFGMLRLRRA